MQVRNNYELDIFNGDLGRIESIHHGDRELTVMFDERMVVIPSDHLEDVVPAYACTIHKSQGSEYPAVVIVLHHQHHVMLQRNLLYTAITRGRSLVVIVGSKRALGRAVSNATVRERHTLYWRPASARAWPRQTLIDRRPVRLCRHCCVYDRAAGSRSTPDPRYRRPCSCGVARHNRTHTGSLPAPVAPMA